MIKGSVFLPSQLHTSKKGIPYFVTVSLNSAIRAEESHACNSQDRSEVSQFLPKDVKGARTSLPKSLDLCMLHQPTFVHPNNFQNHRLRGTSRP